MCDRMVHASSKNLDTVMLNRIFIAFISLHHGKVIFDVNLPILCKHLGLLYNLPFEKLADPIYEASIS
jgi:hypothetical protein